MMKYQKLLISSLVLIVMGAFALTGCGSSKNQSASSANNKSTSTSKSTTSNSQNIKPNKQSSKTKVKTEDSDFNKPVTLKMWAWTGGGNKWYDQFLGQYIKKKFPNVTIEVIPKDWKKDIAGNNIPDLMAGTAASDIVQWENYGISYDLSSLIKKDKYDLSRFDQAALQTVKNYSNSGQLYALPWYSSGAALFYSKDIFDKFGVPYPTNGMNWSQVLSLARRVTRNSGGIQYHGFELGIIRYYQEEYGLQAYDPKTKQATYTTNPRWAKILQFAADVFKIPGNQLSKKYNGWNVGMNEFRKKKDLAMVPWTAWYQPFLQAKQTGGLNFGVVSMPTWSDAKGQGVAPWGVVWGISKQSKHKDLDFAIIKYMESNQVMLQQARDGQIPALDLTKNKDVVNQFGANIPGSKEVDLSKTFYDKYTPVPKVDGNLENAAESAIHNALQNVVNNQMDVNTALRKAEEEANQAINKALGK